jgi:hypothetical protein
MKFLGMCIFYLFNTEGLFDQALRVIFGLFRLATGQPIPPADLNELELSTIREGFEEARIPTDVLFDGYDKHVRNAIAHSRFRYNDKNITMKFSDYNKTKKEWVVKSFSIYKFSELVLKLDDVSHLLLTIIFMFRIHQLVLPG